MFFSIGKKIPIEGYEKNERKMLFTDIRNSLKIDYTTSIYNATIVFNRSRTRMGTSLGAVLHTGLHGSLSVSKDMGNVKVKINNVGAMLVSLLALGMGVAIMILNLYANAIYVGIGLCIAAVVSWVIFYSTSKEMMIQIVEILKGTKGVKPEEASLVRKVKQDTIG